MVFHDSITVRDYEPVIISCVRKVPPSNRFLVRPKLGKKGRLESKNGMANEKGEIIQSTNKNLRHKNRKRTENITTSKRSPGENRLRSAQNRTMR